jgi:hypothetical protein
MIPALKPENIFWPEKGLSAKNKVVNQIIVLIWVRGYLHALMVSIAYTGVAAGANSLMPYKQKCNVICRRPCPRITIGCRPQHNRCTADSKPPLLSISFLCLGLQISKRSHLQRTQAIISRGWGGGS